LTVLLLKLLSLSTLCLSFSNSFREKTSLTIINQKDIRDVELLESSTQELERETLEILPSNFEEVLAQNNIVLNYEELVYFLNNGYLFIEHNAEKSDLESVDNENEKQIKKVDKYIDISSIYNDLSHNNNQIYISSQVLSHYFSNKFREIKNTSIEYNRLRKTLKRKASNLQTRIAFSGGQSLIEGKGIYSLPLFQKESLENIARYSDIELIVENDIENYENLQKQIGDVDARFGEFEDISKEINSVLNFIEKKNRNEKTTDEKLVLIEIIEKLPPVLLEEEEGSVPGYLLKNVRDSLLIFPYITNNLDIVSKESNRDNFNMEYDITPSPQLEGTVRIPILMYHHIATPSSDSSEFKKGLYVEPEMFEKQIAYLTKKNYKSISIEEFYNILQTGINPSQKSIVISFDDSLLSHYHNAFPILKKYGHTGVFFVPSEVGLLPKEQLIEMSNSGMDIQSHSATHPLLNRINNRAMLEREVVGSKKTLEELTGRSVTAFAYPGCVGNSVVFRMVSDSGYNMGFSCGRSIDHSIDGRLVLPRTQVYNDMNQFLTILSGTY
jgi:peptidoglycan/xylan/chitin deacetylase (PgdA/CDA1 family)